MTVLWFPNRYVRESALEEANSLDCFQRNLLRNKISQRQKLMKKKRGNFGLTAIKSKEEIFLGKRGTDAQRAHIGVGLVQLGYWQGQRQGAESKKSLQLKTQAERRSWMLPKTCLPHRKVLPQAEKTEVGKCTQDWLYFSRQEILKQRAMLVTSAVQVRCVYAGATLT